VFNLRKKEWAGHGVLEGKGHECRIVEGKPGEQSSLGGNCRRRYEDNAKTSHKVIGF
jgi:hypothetical protein